MDATEAATNLSLQVDEIEALSAIFGDDFLSETQNSFSVRIRTDGFEVLLQVLLPKNYPLNSPPVYELSAPWMSREAKVKVLAEIQEACSQNVGESVIYEIIEIIKNFISNQNKYDLGDNVVGAISEDSASSELENVSFTKDIELPVIDHGEQIIDRKSIFQAHFAQVKSENQVKLVLEKLKENSKIASAEHNVYAYRIVLENGKILEGQDDDGEAKASSNLLHLLQISDLSNILIVVSRWYGGIHLGSLRFKHYKNAAKSLISWVTEKEKKADRPEK